MVVIATMSLSEYTDHITNTDDVTAAVAANTTVTGVPARPFGR